MREPQITMPKACDSCVHYTAIGFAYDEHCPFKGAFASSQKPSRTPYGRCDVHCSQVFATEICESYEVEPFVLAIPVTNRPVPMNPRQERLSLGS